MSSMSCVSRVKRFLVGTVVFHRRSLISHLHPWWSDTTIVVISAHHRGAAAQHMGIACGQPLVTIAVVRTHLSQSPAHLHTQRHLSMMRRRVAMSPWYSSCYKDGAEPDIIGLTEIAFGREAQMTRDFRIPSASAHPGL
jgi:hypothetical protein